MSLNDEKSAHPSPSDALDLSAAGCEAEASKLSKLAQLSGEPAVSMASKLAVQSATNTQLHIHGLTQ